MATIQQLALIPLFSKLAPQDLSIVAKYLRGQMYPEGAVIVERNQPGDSMYIIVDGLVKVHTTTESGAYVILGLLRSGEFFGEMSAIDGQTRSATVTAIEDTKALILDSTGFRSIVASSDTFAWTILQTLASRVRLQNDTLETLATRDVIGRVAKLLARLADRHGTSLSRARNAKHATGVGTLAVKTAVEEPIVIELSLTQSDIAAFVGATRERVSQTMSMLRSTNIISREAGTGYIVIDKPNKLAQIASDH
ncbi:MAG TPA: Crp/Fnr family transcriptional regulator [Capsulimonadaceae bacterium]|jgi:CRP/FNR family transcriptional regulator/CRP/FNR family cyclic AMP-dependent transcriptional regulator